MKVIEELSNVIHEAAELDTSPDDPCPGDQHAAIVETEGCHEPTSQAARTRGWDLGNENRHPRKPRRQRHRKARHDPKVKDDGKAVSLDHSVSGTDAEELPAEVHGGAGISGLFTTSDSKLRGLRPTCVGADETPHTVHQLPQLLTESENLRLERWLDSIDKFKDRTTCDTVEGTSGNQESRSSETASSVKSPTNGCHRRVNNAGRFKNKTVGDLLMKKQWKLHKVLGDASNKRALSERCPAPRSPPPPCIQRFASGKEKKGRRASNTSTRSCPPDLTTPPRYSNTVEFDLPEHAPTYRYPFYPRCIDPLRLWVDAQPIRFRKC